MDSPLTTIFSFVGAFYGLVLPAAILLGAALLFIPSMMAPGAKAQKVGEALHCYAMMVIGILLMTLGALPTVFSVFAGLAFTGRTYLGLLVVFACGGALFLAYEQIGHRLDSASKAVPAAIYFLTVKFVGNTLALLSALSILLTLIIGSAQAGWWVLPFVLFFYGLLLSWVTRNELEGRLFESAPIMKKIAPAKMELEKLSPLMKRKKK